MSATRLLELLDLLSLRRLRERELPRSLTGAVLRGDREMVELFLAKGARPDERNAATYAVSRGRVDLLQVLFDAGLDPAGREARSALEMAASHGKAAMMRLLIERGVVLSEYDRRFASMMAERNGHADIAAFLDGKRPDLEGVADAPDPESPVQFRPSGRAEDGWSEERIEEEALAIVRSGELSALGAAIEADAIAVAEALLDRGADPAEGAPIAIAASHGHASLVERLAPLVPQAQRDEALVRAASFGVPAMVETLLRAGADPVGPALAKAAGPYRDEIRALLRRALRERGAKPQPALAAEGAKPRKRVATLRGVREFVKPLVDTHPTWTIVAVREAIDEVTPRLPAVRVELDVAFRGVELATSGVFVFQLAGHPWTIALADFDVAALSRALACEALLCQGSDASGTFGIARYGRGERIDQAEWYFDQLAKADAYATAIDLFLPGCRIDTLGISPRLDLWRIDPGAVKRLDYLVLED